MSKVFDKTVIDDLYFRYTKVTLSNTFNYTTSFTIQNVQLKMLCGYNTRVGQRWVVLTDSYGNVILSQTFLKYQKQCELNFNSNEYNLNHFITLVPKDKTKSFGDDYNYAYWANDFDLYFIGYPKEISERAKSNYIIKMVGNN